MNQKKYVIFLTDGMADEPLVELNNLTPLQYAKTPNIDKLAEKSIIGKFLTLPDGFPTSSDVANMSVLGFDLKKSYTGRGPLEAKASGFDLQKHDIAFRLNIIKTNGNILEDYSAGHIDNNYAKIIINELNKQLGNDKIFFHPGVSYRNSLILRGEEFSSNIKYFKPDSSHGENINSILPRALSNDAKYTEEIIQEIMVKSIGIIKNITPTGTGEPTMVWPWSPGKIPVLNNFQKKWNKKSAVVTAVDVIRGIGLFSGMDILQVEGATGYIDTNYEGKAEKTFEALSGDYDFVYCHLEAIDEVSHLGDLEKKIKAIEDFDKRLLGRFLESANDCKIINNLNIAILPDHPVPIKLRKHTRTPVPFMIYNSNFDYTGNKYNEVYVDNHADVVLEKEEFIKKLFDL